MQVRRALAWTVLGQACLFLIQFGGQVTLTRLLTPYEIGVYAAGLATTGVLAAIQAFGLNSFIVREHALDSDLLRTVFTINAMISLGLALITFMASYLLSSFLHDRGVLDVLRVLALLPLVAIFDFRPSALMQRNMQFRALALTSATRALATTTATISLALSGFSYMSMAWGSLIGALAGMVLNNTIGRHHVSLRVGVRHWRRVVAFGLQILAISGVGQISSRLSSIILGRLLGLAALGFFSRADAIVGMLWDNIHGVLARVVLADFAAHMRQGAQTLGDRYKTTLAMITAVLWPAFIGLAILARPLVHAIFGARWISSALPLSFLSVAAAVLVTTSMAWEVFVVCGQTGAQARFEFLRGLFSFIAFTAGAVVSVPLAAASRIGEAMFAQVLYAPRLARMTGINRQAFGATFNSVYAPSLLATAAATGPAILLMISSNWSPSTSISLVVGAVVLGALLWLTALSQLRHPLYAEFRSVISRFKV